MPEAGFDDPSKEVEPVAVATSEETIGYEVKTSGAQYPLRQLRAYGGGGMWNELYFRTKSGNIYRVHEDLLIDGNESQKRGQIVEIPLVNADKQRVEIGKPFVYPGGRSAEVTEFLLLAPRRMAPPRQVLEMTQGRKNSMAKDFIAKLPRDPDLLFEYEIHP